MRHEGWVFGNGARSPVLSVGMVPFYVDTSGLRVMMIRRKVTVGFMDFVRGKYSVANIHRLVALIDTMTLIEKELILSGTYTEMWAKAWGEGHSGGAYRLEAEQANGLLETIRRGVSLGGELVALEGLVKQSTTSWTEPEWEFPKGRKNFQEKDIDCAYREVAEETGLHRCNFDVVRNISPIEETFIGSNLKSYKYRYYLANVSDSSADLSKFQKSEIGDARWFSCDEAIDVIRSYHIEKQRVVEQVRKTLESVQLFHAE